MTVMTRSNAKDNKITDKKSYSKVSTLKKIQFIKGQMFCYYFFFSSTYIVTSKKY